MGRFFLYRVLLVPVLFRCPGLSGTVFFGSGFCLVLFFFGSGCLLGPFWFGSGFLWAVFFGILPPHQTSGDFEDKASRKTLSMCLKETGTLQDHWLILVGASELEKRNGYADYNCTSVQIRNLLRAGIALPGFARKAAASNSGSSVSDMDDAASVGQSTADDTDYADAASDSSSANPFGDAAVTRNSVYQLVGRTLVGVHWPLAKFKKKFGKSGVRGLRFKWCGVEGVLLPFEHGQDQGCSIIEKQHIDKLEKSKILYRQLEGGQSCDQVFKALQDRASSSLVTVSKKRAFIGGNAPDALQMKKTRYAEPTEDEGMSLDDMLGEMWGDSLLNTSMLSEQHLEPADEESTDVAPIAAVEKNGTASKHRAVLRALSDARRLLEKIADAEGVLKVKESSISDVLKRLGDLLQDAHLVAALGKNKAKQGEDFEGVGMLEQLKELRGQLSRFLPVFQWVAELEKTTAADAALRFSNGAMGEVDKLRDDTNVFAAEAMCERLWVTIATRLRKASDFESWCAVVSNGGSSDAQLHVGLLASDRCVIAQTKEVVAMHTMCVHMSANPAEIKSNPKTSMIEQLVSAVAGFGCEKLFGCPRLRSSWQHVCDVVFCKSATYKDLREAIGMLKQFDHTFAPCFASSAGRAIIAVADDLQRQLAVANEMLTELSAVVVPEPPAGGGDDILVLNPPSGGQELFFNPGLCWYRFFLGRGCLGRFLLGRFLLGSFVCWYRVFW